MRRVARGRPAGDLRADPEPRKVRSTSGPTGQITTGVAAIREVYERLVAAKPRFMEGEHLPTLLG